MGTLYRLARRGEVERAPRTVRPRLTLLDVRGDGPDVGALLEGNVCAHAGRGPGACAEQLRAQVMLRRTAVLPLTGSSW
jgi:hypothetical protein